MLNMIGNLGGSAAAVAVLWMCLSFIKSQNERQEKLFAGLYEELRDLAKDKGQVIRENTAAMRENTSMVAKLEGSIKGLDTVVHIAMDRAPRRPPE